MKFILANYEGPGVNDRTIWLRLMDRSWIEISGELHLPLAPGEKVTLAVTPCKHHGETLCRCPPESRIGGGISVLIGWVTS